MSIKDAVLSTISRKFIASKVGELPVGRLEINLPSGEKIELEGDASGAPGVMDINRWGAFSQLLRLGDIGLAEGYVRGDWDSPDLNALMCVLARNVDSFNDEFSASGIDRVRVGVQHAMRRNTRKQSRRNIEAHYDLGNTFYELWLDPTMTYSSALFSAEERPLEAAQLHKYQRMLEQAELEPGSHILEVGCGWGGFAEFAANAGHRVTGITISPAQHSYASRRLAAAIKDGSIKLELRDYRDLLGRFDAVVSIEMFEAVGKEWWSNYMQVVKGSLAPAAKAVIQTIDIRDDLFEGYSKSADFIQAYIFPGGMLPSPRRFVGKAVEQGLSCRDSHHFGASYAQTLHRWQKNFNAADSEVRHLGFGSEFIRLWNFYLSYCFAGFESGRTDVGQYTLEVKH